MGKWGNKAKMCSWLLSPEGVRLHIGRKGKSIEGIRDGKITNEYTCGFEPHPLSLVHHLRGICRVKTVIIGQSAHNKECAVMFD